MKSNFWIGLLVLGLFGTAACQFWGKGIARPDYENVDAVYSPGLTRDTQSRPEVVERVSDGDTLVLNTGEKVRLCGIDSPEKEQPLGNPSKSKLEALVRSAGNQVLVWEVEKDRYGRTVAEVFISASTPEQPEGETFVNSEMVQTGMAYLYPKYVGSCPNKDAIAEAERIAKSSKVGVWAGNYQVPWEFRKAQQLRDMKGGVEFDPAKFRPAGLPDYCGLCGWALALAHAKSGDAAMLAGYVGKSEELDEALTTFAHAYADQTERDYEQLAVAARQGRIQVSSEF
ncbi:MAG: DUF2252 family protein [Leptolyngbyaceae cyanobacterium RU_5_1]|nr:DUF2252 family protein [Leptolyngbyaceae cyanobacterium RU_5_1]